MYQKYFTPNQREKANTRQVKNNAGGYVYVTDIQEAIKRFLILGTEGGTYYAKEREHTLQALDTVKKALYNDYRTTLRTTVSVWNNNQAPKFGPVAAVLALGLAHDDIKVRKATEAAVDECVRTFDHLALLLSYVKQIRGFGRLMRRIVRKFYDRHENDLSLHVCKYMSRRKWKQEDVLRAAHPKPKNEFEDQLFGWIMGKKDAPKDKWVSLYNALRHAKDEQRVVEILKDSEFVPHEFVPSQLHTAKVFEELVRYMPYQATLRRLAHMHRLGLLKPFSPTTSVVVERLRNEEQMKRARIHPVLFLLALMAGRDKFPKPVLDVLEENFFKAFEYTEPIRGNTLVAVDISGSMYYSGNPEFRPAAIAAAMCAVLNKIGNTETMVFAERIMRVTPPENPLEVYKYLYDIGEKHEFSMTDCALPMLEAMEENMPVDNFIVITDNETWYGHVHPDEALRRYRRKMNKPKAKLAVVACTATNFSIADPRDSGMADFVGFDASLPKALGEFLNS